MDGLLLVLLLGLNILISIWNCYAVGSTWRDTMFAGSRLDKAVLWSGLIQSGIGFSMPILLLLMWIVVKLFTGTAEDATLTPEEAAQLMTWVSSFWYLLVIFPILLSGFTIWAHTLKAFWYKRSIGNTIALGWNTFAQIHNTMSAIENLGGVLGDVGELFSSIFDGDSDAKGKLALIAIVVVIISLALGFMIAFALVKRFARSSTSYVEKYMEESRTSYARG